MMARQGGASLKDGAAINVKVRKNDQFRQGHQPRVGVPRDPRLDLVKQLLAFMTAVGNGPREGCTKRVEPQSPCLFCPPLFPRTSGRSRTFDLSRQPPSDEVSAMVVRGLSHVGYDTSLLFGISARRGGGASPPPLRLAYLMQSYGCKVIMRRTLLHGNISS